MRKRSIAGGLVGLLVAALATVVPGGPAAAGAAPTVGVAVSPSGGHWVVDGTGRVTAGDGAGHHGSVDGRTLTRPVVAIAATPTGNGYWLTASDGGIFTFGDARYLGSTGAMTLNQPIVGIAATPTGNGYWLTASDGGIFTFGDARYLGSTGAMTLNQPIVGIAATPTGNGYWLTASDGGIFTFGDARYLGSTGAMTLNQPIVGIAATPTGNGYWLAARDGGIFTFGDAAFAGAGPAQVTAVTGGDGYTLATVGGTVANFGPRRQPNITTPSPGSLLFSTGYDLLTGVDLVPGWQTEQEPAVGGVVQRDRITLVDGHGGRAGRAMRVELRPYESAPGRADGDVTNTGGYLANRAEVYGRHPSRSTPVADWPDPVGSTRWYGFDLFVPATFTFDTTGRQWFTLTQWKGLHGGSPPIALEIKNRNLELGGATGRQDLGPVRPGQWERIAVGVHHSPTAGWVEVHRNGVPVLPRTSRPTMDPRTVGGLPTVDPTYLKQGIYRTKRWAVTHVLYFGDLTIGAHLDDVR